MNKKRKFSWKKLIIVLVVLLVIVGIIFGVSYYMRSKKVAMVVPVSSVMTEYYGDEMESSGMLTNDSTQAIYLSEEDQVAAVYVTEGQQVSAGTPLMKYDVDEINDAIAEKQISIQQAANDIAILGVQLEKLRSIVPVSDENEDVEEPETEIYKPTGPEKEAEAYRYLKKKAKAYKGSGTAEKPYVYLCTSDCYATAEFLNNIKEKKAYCVFEVRSKNKKSGELQNSVTLNGKHMFEVEDNMLYSIRTGEIYYPYDEDDEYEDDPIDEPVGITYTRRELRDEISEKQNELIEIQSSLRKDQIELKQLQDSLSDATIVAKMDGVVKKLGDINNFEDDGTPFMVITASEGLYVEGQINELYLKQLKKGQVVQGTDWMTGTEFEATVEEIEDTPSQNQMYYGEGNPNASFYIYRAFIENTEGLENGDSVDLKMTLEGSSNGIFIEKAFVKDEDGTKVVYIKGKDGKLKKKKVTTGRTIWGYYVEILEGVTEDDYIAFPYGDTAQPGIRCEETDYLY